MTKLCVKNPYSGELIEELSFESPSAIQKKLTQAVTHFETWSRSSSWERSQLLNEAAHKIEATKEEFASLICKEAGKPIRLARVEVDRALSVLRWASAEALRFGGELLRLDTATSGRSGFGIHTRFPKGVILGITPFNFPLNLVIHKVAPALACGCTIVVKPSPYTPLVALRLAEVFDSIRPGLFQVILTDAEGTAALTRAPEIAKISFTGSAAVGWQIRKQAPEKPTTLELGGNAWVIIGEDVDPSLYPKISQKIATGAFGYAGQSCISVQNVAVSKTVWKDFQPHLNKATEETSFGDPSSSSILCGPVINRDAAQRIQSQLASVKSEVAMISSQKKEGPLATGDALIAPTLVVFEKESPSPLVQEEIFGPVMTARKFETLSDVITQINSSRYGLQAGIFTDSWRTIQTLYQELKVGGLVVNDLPTTRYDHQPYGGVKDSGQGREGVRYAMEEMTDSKFLALSDQIL